MIKQRLYRTAYTGTVGVKEFYRDYFTIDEPLAYVEYLTNKLSKRLGTKYTTVYNRINEKRIIITLIDTKNKEYEYYYVIEEVEIEEDDN